MREGFEMMAAAVVKAYGHEFNVNKFSDRLIMQKGCFILNSWGYEPKYEYNLYIRGPYSRNLASDYYKAKMIPTETTIPDEAVERLKEIFDKGIGYAEAYATVLLIKDNNPRTEPDLIMSRALELKPSLRREVKEACEQLLARGISTHAA